MATFLTSVVADVDKAKLAVEDANALFDQKRAQAEDAKQVRGAGLGLWNLLRPLDASGGWRLVLVCAGCS